VARLLLDRSADISASNEPGWTPFHLVAFNGYKAEARLFIDSGADASAAADDDGYTPLHLAATYGHQAVARLLRDRGAT
jgi:ankyrin repeat protein